MELIDFLKENSFVELNPNEGINHQVFRRQHTLVSFWNDSVAVTSYGRVNHTGGKESTLEYLQNLKDRGRNH